MKLVELYQKKACLKRERDRITRQFFGWVIFPGVGLAVLSILWLAFDLGALIGSLGVVALALGSLLWGAYYVDKIGRLSQKIARIDQQIAEEAVKNGK